jgi:hypothetical protein
MPPPKSPLDPKQVYDQADRFHLAEHLLNVQLAMDDATRNMVRIPAMVVSAFSAELYLKCLLLLEDKSFGAIHNLHKLFVPLTDATKVKVQAQWDEMLTKTATERDAFEKKYGTVVPKDIAAALSECGDTFELLRYVYEGKTIKHYTPYLPLVFRRVIKDLTGWK